MHHVASIREGQCLASGFMKGNFTNYSVIHISIHPSKELCSKMDPGEVGVSLP